MVNSEIVIREIINDNKILDKTVYAKYFEAKKIFFVRNIFNVVLFKILNLIKIYRNFIVIYYNQYNLNRRKITVKNIKKDVRNIL